jgi:CRISPR-associated protein Csb1
MSRGKMEDVLHPWEHVQLDIHADVLGWGRGATVVRPSEINHGHIALSVQPLGVTCDYAEHMAVISFAGL